MKSFGDLYAEFVMTKKKDLQDVALAKAESIEERYPSSVDTATVDALVGSLIKADGIVSGGEANFIDAIAKKKGISSDEIKKNIMGLSDDDAKKAKADFKKLPDDVKEDIVFILLCISSSDGLIAKNEYASIKDLCN